MGWGVADSSIVAYTCCMYTATMNYSFHEKHFDQACTLWRDKVLELAEKQQGFVRMQFLVAPPRALALGTWLKKEDAEAFMQTGVFKDLMVELQPLCSATPVPAVWDLLFFSEK